MVHACAGDETSRALVLPELTCLALPLLRLTLVARWTLGDSPSTSLSDASSGDSDDVLLLLPASWNELSMPTRLVILGCCTTVACCLSTEPHFMSAASAITSSSSLLGNASPVDLRVSRSSASISRDGVARFERYSSSARSSSVPFGEGVRVVIRGGSRCMLPRRPEERRAPPTRPESHEPSESMDARETGSGEGWMLCRSDVGVCLIFSSLSIFSSTRRRSDVGVSCLTTGVFWSPSSPPKPPDLDSETTGRGTSTSGDPTRESGGLMGSSGRSSLNRDLFLLFLFPSRKRAEKEMRARLLDSEFFRGVTSLSSCLDEYCDTAFWSDSVALGDLDLDILRRKLRLSRMLPLGVAALVLGLRSGTGCAGSVGDGGASGGMLVVRWKWWRNATGSGSTSIGSGCGSGCDSASLVVDIFCECLDELHERLREDVTTADGASMPSPASRPMTPRSMLTGGGEPLFLASASISRCLSALRASRRSTRSWSLCRFLSLLLLSRSISSLRSAASRSSAKLSTLLCALTTDSGTLSETFLFCCCVRVGAEPLPGSHRG
ncbi:hypothetical protein ColKHC_09077 [Colletotrichum higginsianum]|nr:hypothetical protein ColKHC_09077 [Colletotrichum higginsianum]